MSRLAGYALPGAVFLLFGAKWSWRASAPPRGEDGGSTGAASAAAAIPAAPSAPPGEDASEGALSQRARPRKRRCGSSCPLEGLVKLCVAGVGVVASLVAAYPDGSVEYVGDVLHATAYLFFALSGLADVLAHYCSPAVSSSFARLAFALAFLVEGALFLLALPPDSHSDGTTVHPSAVTERRMLCLLVSAAWGCAASVALEDLFPALSFLRCLSALVHGSWFVHTGLVLHWQRNRSWDIGVEDALADGQSVWVSLAFAWHVAAALSVVIALLVARRGCADTPPAVPEFDGFGAAPRNSHPRHPCPYCDGHLGGHHHAPC